MKYILFFDEVGQNDIHLAGGKGASLGEMTQSGFPVPSGLILTTDAYRDFYNQTIPQSYQEELLKAFEKLDANYVAVRSSAISEDSTNASWAGQLESYLNVDKEHLVDSIEKCWKSVTSKRALIYAKEKNVHKSQLIVAVVIQKMINSDKSGVMFTANPVTNNKDELMVEAGYGLGEMIVQGEITPDNYLVNKHSLQILDSSLGSQKTMLAYKNGQNRKIPVPNNLQSKQILTNTQIKNLARLGLNIEKHYHSPQDIEWALENNKFYIVQSRPITTLKK